MYHRRTLSSVYIKGLKQVYVTSEPEYKGNKDSFGLILKLCFYLQVNCLKGVNRRFHPLEGVINFQLSIKPDIDRK